MKNQKVLVTILGKSYEQHLCDNLYFVITDTIAARDISSVINSSEMRELFKNGWRDATHKEYSKLIERYPNIFRKYEWHISTDSNEYSKATLILVKDANFKDENAFNFAEYNLDQEIEDYYDLLADLFKKARDFYGDKRVDSLLMLGYHIQEIANNALKGNICFQREYDIYIKLLDKYSHSYLKNRLERGDNLSEIKDESDMEEELLNK